MSLADQPYCYHCATYGHEPSECWASPDRAALSHGTRQAEPVALSTLTVTDAMVDAYLEANNAYWHFSDQLPSKPGVWRNGTPREATKVSLEAALAASAPALQAGQGETFYLPPEHVARHTVGDWVNASRTPKAGWIAYVPTHERAAPAPEELLAEWQEASGRTYLTASERVDLLQLIRAAQKGER